jgi:hypothetical protein
MRKQKYKFVEQNIEMIRTLTKDGYVSGKLLVYYNIYKTYMDIKSGSKTNRYIIVANETRSSVTTVRRAVSDMKSYVKD